MDLFSQILNQSKLGTPGQFSGGTSFGSINTQDFQSKLPTIQKSVQAEQNLRNQGFSEKEVKFLKLQKEKGVDMNQAFAFVEQKRKEETQKVQQEKGILGSDANRQGFMQNALGVGVDIVGGATSEVPRFLGNTASWMSRMGNKLPTNTIPTAIKAGFSDKTYGELRAEQDAQSQVFANVGQKGKELVQSTGLYDPTTFSSKVGEFGTQIGGSLIGPNKVGILKKGTQAINAGKKLTTAGKIGDIALEGGLAGAKFDIGTKGEVTPESVALGAIGNVGVAGILKGAGKAYEGITRKMPASLTLGGLINPGKLDVVKKTLQVDEGVATPEDVGKWILDRVKPGNKQEIAEQLVQHAEKSKGAVDEALASIPTYFKNNEAKKALMQIRNELEGKVGLEGRLAQIDEMLAKPEYTLSELNAVKRELDNMYNLYTKTADPTAGIKAEGLRNVRANIRGFIEKEAEKYGVNIRKLNNETSVARGLADGILRKDSSESIRELLTPFAPSGAGAAIGAGQAIARGEDPLTVLRDALIGGIATKLGTSTAVRTRIASALNNLAPKELTALESYIKSGGRDAIGRKVAEKVIKEGRALPARTLTKESDFAKQAENSIITPQTMEAGIIQESKKGLSSNVKRPNGNTINTPSNSGNVPLRSTKIQEPSTKVKPLSNGSKVNNPASSTNSTSANSETVKKPLKKEVVVKKLSDEGKAGYTFIKKGEFTESELMKAKGVAEAKIAKGEKLSDREKGGYKAILEKIDELKVKKISSEKAEFQSGYEAGKKYGPQDIKTLKEDIKRWENWDNTPNSNFYSPPTKNEILGYKKALAELEEIPEGYIKKPLKKEVKPIENTKSDYDVRKTTGGWAVDKKEYGTWGFQAKFSSKKDAIAYIEKKTTEIPEGYIKNMLGEIIKKPSNSKGGFVRLPSVKPRKLESPASPDKALVEEARKYEGVEGLKKIGFGSDRDVYKLSNNLVVKKAKNEIGKLQNNTLIKDSFARNYGLLPRIYKKGDDFIITDFVKEPDINTKKMVEEIQSIDMRRRVAIPEDIYNKKLDKLVDTLNRYGYNGNAIRDYADNISWGDFERISNWGTLKGKPIHVDEGTFDSNTILKTSNIRIKSELE